MLISLVKLAVIIILLEMLLVQISASGKFTQLRGIKKRKRNRFNFKEVVELNKQYEPLADKCRLRIVGGEPCTRGELPYQVALRKAQRRGQAWIMFCGGSIVTEKHVLSAAHCFAQVNLKNVRVIAGSVTPNAYFPRDKEARLIALKKLQEIEIWRSIEACHQHSKYHRSKFFNDLAVVELKKDFQFTSTVNAIPMAASRTKKPVNTTCLVSGFGLVERNKRTNVLRKVCIPTHKDAPCKRFFRAYRGRNFQICAGGRNGKDSCMGDSGGPLVCKGILTGIVSYGSKKCGAYPAVYTFLSGYTGGKKIRFRKCSAVQVRYNILEIIIGLASTHAFHIVIVLVHIN